MFSRLSRTRTIAAAGLAACCGLAFPALSDPEDRAVVIVDPNEEESLYLANVYANARGIPESRFIYMRPDAEDYQSFVGFNIEALFAELERRGINEQVDFVIVAPTRRTRAFRVPAPGLASDDCPAGVQRFGVGSAYTLAFLSDEVLLGGRNSTEASEFAARSTQSAARLDSETVYRFGAPTTRNGERYFMGSMLGYTGARGNTVNELIDMIERSAAADGTNPAGGFYFMRTNDPARSLPREPLFTTAAAEVTAQGGQAFIQTGVLPAGPVTAAGVLTGVASPGVATSMVTMADGSFGDHLTSWAATFDIATQDKVSTWIRAGASASYGCVEEPCNFAGKFPSARLHGFYLEGVTLGEAVFRSLEFRPYQGLFYGDPLARAWEIAPQVSLVGAAPEVVSGASFQIEVDTITAKPGASVNEVDVLIDGVRILESEPSGVLTIPLTNISDGWHEIRIVARDDSDLMTEGSWIGSFTNASKGRRVDASANVTTGDRRSLFEFTYTFFGEGAVETRLVHNGRVLDAIERGVGILSAYGNDIGAGVTCVHVEALMADGSVIRSEPIELDIAFASGGSNTPTPQAVDFTVFLAGSGEPKLVNLPGKSDRNPDGEVFSIVSAPAGFTIDLGEAGACLVTPPASPTTNATLRYRVDNGSGQGTEGEVTLVVVPFDLDRDGDGMVTPEDLYEQVANPIDADGDGDIDGDDFALIERAARFGEVGGMDRRR